MKLIICLSFVAWMVIISSYSWLMLGIKYQYFSRLADINLIPDTPETKLLQRERGGIRRVRNQEIANKMNASLSKLV
ncbi:MULTISPECIES: hypothetical protein [Nostocales]|uniref:hypothetical protein n=1 Tax=Nostocales TaxID=1161 RepID=UPI00168628EF|nr:MULTISPECIES: hypothetical protein [Nostocales]MBD2476155.1 hypothetical protein [Anabaena sp. FACHB-83]MBD2488512.1 hypothetical protein [Aulosira sp. FACHB-615]